MNAFLRSTMFNPPWWSIFLNPHFLPRRALFRAMRDAGPRLQGCVLDLGCGIQPYRELLTNATAIVGLELDTPQNRSGDKRVDVFYDGMTIPFSDGDFQSVLCNQVLEHVQDPQNFLGEISRVLAPEGTLILSVPFFWPEHEQPWDMQRFTSFGLVNQLTDTGFELVSHDKLVGGSAALCALMADRINAKVSRFPLPVRLLTRATIIAFWSLLGSALLIFPKNDPNLFLDNFVVARKTR